jgi:hypothetical protein
MNFTLRLIESNSEIQRLILENIKDYLEPRINSSIHNIQNELSTLVADGLRQEPEYQSLMSGQLKAELGLPDGGMVDSIITHLSNATEVSRQSLRVTQNGISGGFIIRMIKSDDLGGALNQVSASINIDGGSLPWLEWLTLRGNEILVKDYTVQFGPNPRSRSGLAIMKPSSGDKWRVPPAFVGTINNNWITRAISRIENNVYNLFIKNIEAEI